MWWTERHLRPQDPRWRTKYPYWRRDLIHYDYRGALPGESGKKMQTFVHIVAYHSL